MQQYDKHTAAGSRAVGNSSRTPVQPPVKAILQRYCTYRSVPQGCGNTGPVQCVKKDGTPVDLNTEPFPVLAWLKSQAVRLHDNPAVLSLPYEEKFGTFLYRIESGEDIQAILAAYEKRQAGNDTVLYEGVSGKADASHRVIYPGLDSCLGITVTDTVTSLKTGAHFVVPFTPEALHTYRENLDRLLTVYSSLDASKRRVVVSSDSETQIQNHIDDITQRIDWEIYGKDNPEINEVLRILETFKADTGIMNDRRTGDSNDRTGPDYSASHLHVIDSRGNPNGKLPGDETHFSNSRVYVRYSPDEAQEQALHVIPDTYRAIREIAEDKGVEAFVIESDLIPAFEANRPYRSYQQLAGVLQAVEGISRRVADYIAEYLYDNYSE